MSIRGVALGMFDSVHIGHRSVLEGAISRSENCMAVTFDALPTKKGGLVLTAEERQRKLCALGVDSVCVLEFDKIKNLSPKEFLDSLIVDKKVDLIACGFNFRFGKNAEGNTDFLKGYCKEKGVSCYIAPEVKYNGKTVSTSYIKELLAEGNIKIANELLDSYFSITAEVISGDKRGRKLGFPTINQKYPEEKANIRFGVYETEVSVDSVLYKGVTNVGQRPTFQTEEIFAETFIIDYDGDCYGKKVRLSFKEYIREEKSFDSIEELKAAINASVLYVKNKGL